MTDTAIQRTNPTGMELLDRLSRTVTDPQAVVEIGKQIVDLEVRREELRQSRDRFEWEKLDREAKVAFAEAFKKFKEDMPKILKTKHVQITPKDPNKTGASYWHVELDKACDLLIPALLKVGITHRWKSADLSGGATRVTCYLRHNLGYEEEGASLAGPADTSGGKNPIQGVGSSTSYLERYTFLATCGIVASNTDNDGNPEEDGPLMDEGAAADFFALIEGSSDVDELQRNYFAARDAAKKVGDARAEKSFAEAKNKQYRILSRRTNAGN
jgi:hypothetical protein